MKNVLKNVATCLFAVAVAALFAVAFLCYSPVLVVDGIRRRWS